MAKKNPYVPGFSDIIVSACTDSVERLVKNIMQIDQSIFLWNDLLERSQPFLDGRLLFKFIKHEEWLINGQSHYEYCPVAGKMVKFVSGRWRFVQLDAVDRFEKMSDLRVGKSLPSDPLVKKLIDGIEEMLIERKTIVDLLRAVRVMAAGHSVAITTRAEEMSKLAVKMSRKIKIDWKENTDSAIDALRVQNQLRYEKRKNRLKTKQDLRTNTVFSS
ncbi:hypothetical protein [Rhodoferax antarcticus]|uniref:hypothetical protein n=1 Tax=Rhodoferax antarcticus TaxID=81479 RepID=UPI00094FF6F5|nr:hypothetical protein [Rhodoferax antarcticus]